MRKYLSLIVLFLACACTGAWDSTALCEMALYPDSGLPAPGDAPEGYEPFYISHYGRHGSRAMTAKFAPEIEPVWTALNSAHCSGGLSRKGEALFAEVDKVYRENAEHYDCLTEKGVAQHAGIAARMAANFPSVLKDSASVNVMCSIYPRCISSMKSFTGTLSGELSSLSFRYSCSPAVQGYVNAAVPELIKTEMKKASYFEDVPMDFEPGGAVGAFFRSRGDMEKYVSDCSAFLSGLYAMAANSGNLDIETDLAGLVPAEVMKYYGACQNRRIYYSTMDSAEFGRLRLGNSDSLVVSMLTKADAAVAGNGPDVDLVFGHDFALATYAAMLGLECAPAGLTGKSIDTGFDSSAIIPMAANLQQVFYRGPDGSVLVRFLMNEREVAVSGIAPAEGLFYRWEDVRGRMLSRIQTL